MSEDRAEALHEQPETGAGTSDASGVAEPRIEEGEPTRDDAGRIIVQNYTMAAMAPALVPVPLVDLVMLTGIQLKMLHSLSIHYQQEFSENMSRSAMNALMSSVFPVALKPALASLLKFIPVAGQISGMASMLVLGAAATYALGNVFVRHFSNGGTLENFDAKAVQDYFLEEFEKGKVVAASLKEQAQEYGDALRHSEGRRS